MENLEKQKVGLTKAGNLTWEDLVMNKKLPDGTPGLRLLFELQNTSETARQILNIAWKIRQKAEIKARQNNKQKIMKKAWSIAKKAAKDHGGKPSEFISCALKEAWALYR